MQPTQGGPNRTDTPCPAGAGVRPGLVLLAAGAPGRRSGLPLGPMAHARAAATVGLLSLSAPGDSAWKYSVVDPSGLVLRLLRGLTVNLFSGLGTNHQPW